jgi:hypothetical protein
MTTLRHGFTWVLIAGTLAGTACGANQVSQTKTGNQSAVIRLHVTNDFGSPVTISAVGSGATWNAGKVMPTTTRDFVIPMSLVASGPVEFIAADEFASSVNTGPLMVRGGQVVDFKITRPLNNSTAVVR